ncbi:MAG: (d)CMP kinase [Acetobacteraceae bacterium]|nr:(d)CMP kinase [Acetobacteraceae bacterium]
MGRGQAKPSPAGGGGLGGGGVDRLLPPHGHHPHSDPPPPAGEGASPLIIAVDGPAAAGKGTLARRLAAALGLPHLDTGLLYRAVGRRVLDRGGDPRDPVAAEAEARALRREDLDRTDLRGPAADAASSAVAAIPGVRAALLEFQREFGRAHGAVLDGRDIGTVVFPEARVKLFVTASLAARAKRRWRELTGKGLAVTLAQVEADLRARDAQDVGRATAPLRPAADALQFDTTTLDIDAAFEAAMDLVRARLPR